MDLVVLKVIVTSATFVIAVLGIFASYKLRKFTKWFDVASAFSAGIIIATAYTHMLPEAMEQYHEYKVGNVHEHEDGVGSISSTVSPGGVQMNGVQGSTTPAPKKKCNHAIITEDSLSPPTVLLLLLTRMMPDTIMIMMIMIMTMNITHIIH
jgi:hypothetical protein